MIDVILFSLMIGAIAGLLAGLFGLGGGIVIVPALVWLLDWQQLATDHLMVIAVATSLASIVPTAIATVLAHHKMRAVIWPNVIRLAPGIVIGASTGAGLAHMTDDSTLRWLFIGYLLYVSISMALQFKPILRLPTANWPDYIAGGIIGSMSSLIGIGGGTMTVPYLLSRKLPIKNAIAVSSACGLPIALTSSISYITLGWEQSHLPEYSIGYIYLPAFAGIVTLSIVTAPVGAKLAHKLPAAKMKRFFSLVLCLVAIKMIV